MIPFNIDFSEKRMGYFEKTGECYIPKKELEPLGIDVNYYRVKGKHVNNP